MRLWRNNGLSIVLGALFLLSFVGHALAGHAHSNEERREHHRPAESLGAYLTSGDFIESVFENWESEFLQMGAFVVLTAFLYQRGSPESKDPAKAEDVDEAPELHRGDDNAPAPVRRGGLALALYKHSLSIALFSLFGISFVLHAHGGAEAFSDDALMHGGHAVGTLEYMRTSRFWFESFQNWQSEFLSMGLLVVLGIFLREEGSPESKPVAAPHHQTGR